MNIEPTGHLQRAASARKTELQSAERADPTAVRLASTTNEDGPRLQGPASLSRTLSRSSGELAHASGFVQSGRSATRSIRQELEALRANAEQARTQNYEGSSGSGLAGVFEPALSRVGKQLSTTFQGDAVFSDRTLHVPIASEDLALQEPIEFSLPQAALGQLADLVSTGSFGEIDALLDSLDNALEAASSIETGFDAAARRVQGAGSVVHQERLAVQELSKRNDEELSPEALAEKLAKDFPRSPKRSASLHTLPDPEVLLALLSTPAA